MTPFPDGSIVRLGGVPQATIIVNAVLGEIRERVVAGDVPGGLALASQALDDSLAAESGRNLEQLAGELYALSIGADDHVAQELREFAERAETASEKLNETLRRRREEDRLRREEELRSQLPVVPHVGNAASSPYASLGDRAVAATAMLTLTAAVLVYCIWVAVDEINAVDAVLSVGDVRSYFDLVRFDDRLRVLLLIESGVSIVTLFFFTRWFAQAYRNLGALRGRRRFDARWAVWGWFVPLLNLFRPQTIATEIWVGSDPVLRDLRPDSRPDDFVPLVSLWWKVTVLGWLVQAVTQVFWDRKTPHGLQWTLFAISASFVFAILAAALAVTLIWQITGRQDDRALLLANSG